MNKKTMILLGAMGCIAVAGICFLIGRKSDAVIDHIAVEDQILAVELLDYVSMDEQDDLVDTVSIQVHGGEELCGVTLSQDQTFEKKLHLVGPLTTSTFLEIQETPSHHAYILVLVGDIVGYKEDDEIVYVVENARVEYYCQKLLLESEYNSVYIASVDGKKEQLVSMSTYVATMKDKELFYSLLAW